MKENIKFKKVSSSYYYIEDEEIFRRTTKCPHMFVSNHGRKLNFSYSTSDKTKFRPRIVKYNGNGGFDRDQFDYKFNGVRYRDFVHRELMKVFNPVSNMENLQVNHIDGNIYNNHIDNLEWCDNSYNQNHRLKTIPTKYLTDDDKETILFLHKSGFANSRISKLTNIHYHKVRNTVIKYQNG